MRLIISPAKNMRITGDPRLPLSRPGYLQQSARLLEQLREYPPWQLESLMKINPDIALRAFGYYQSLDLESGGSPAIMSYHGLQYQNIDPQSLTPGELQFLQPRLRIVSAFYGLLRPLDGISPYRLELQCKIKVDGQSLYRFWGDRLYRDLFSPGEPVLNLASAEYSKAVSPFLGARDRFITCDFLVVKRGRLCCLPTAAKMARGQMVRFIARHSIDEPEGVWDFDWDGFEFSPARSDGGRYVFIRD